MAGIPTEEVEVTAADIGSLLSTGNGIPIID